MRAPFVRPDIDRIFLIVFEEGHDLRERSGFPETSCFLRKPTQIRDLRFLGVVIFLVKGWIVSNPESHLAIPIVPGQVFSALYPPEDTRHIPFSEFTFHIQE
jgi:hypothetical protein